MKAGGKSEKGTRTREVKKHGRTMDRKSGDGKRDIERKGGAGKNNWGKPTDSTSCGAAIDAGDPMAPDVLTKK